MASRASVQSSRRKAQALPCLGPVLFILLFTAFANAQSLDARLDEDQFLRGLSELRASEVLEQYITTHPTSDAVRLAQFEIARQRMVLSDPAATPEQRLTAIERILTVRGDLITPRGNDDRRPIWLADQATDLLFGLLPIDASGLTTLVGVPSASQRERASRVAREMNTAASRAEAEIDRVLAGLEPRDGATGNSVSQQRRHRLNEQERQRRIPFLRGVAACLQAQINVKDPAQQRALFTLAADILPPLTQTLEGVAALDARLYASLAQIRLGHFDEAEANLTAVITNQTTPPADLFLARMLSVVNLATKNGPEAALELLGSHESPYSGGGADKVFFRLLIADQRFLLRRAIAAAAPADQRPRLLAAAYSTYTDLLKSDLGILHDTLRAVIFAKLADTADRSTPIDTLPAIVAIARADQMTRSNDPRTLQEAITMLEVAWSRSDLDAFERSTAQFARARSLYSLGKHIEAAQRFLELAQQQTADSLTERAAELATSIAAEQVRAHPQNSEDKALFNRALTVLLTRYPTLPTIDRWRLAAGQLALEDQRYDDAIKTLSFVTAESEQWPEAQFLSARAAVRHAAGATDGSQTRALHEQSLAAIDRAKAALERTPSETTDVNRRRSRRAMLDMLCAQRAESQLGLNQPKQALESLAGIENDPDVDRAALAEALRVRIAAYQSLQQPEKAAAEITRYLDAAPQQALAVIGPMMDSLQAQVQSLIDNGQDDQAADLARNTLLPVAAIIEQRLGSSSAPANEQAAILRRVADARRLSGEYAKALAIYEKLLASQPDVTTLILGRAECLYHLGGEERLAEAMNAYKRLSAAGTAAGSDTFWLSQLRMLQILDAINRNTNQIMPRIERLRQQDTNFGGERFRRGFDALRQKYAGK